LREWMKPSRASRSFSGTLANSRAMISVLLIRFPRLQIAGSIAAAYHRRNLVVGGLFSAVIGKRCATRQDLCAMPGAPANFRITGHPGVDYVLSPYRVIGVNGPNPGATPRSDPRRTAPPRPEPSGPC
jgi:hypothetical protein